MALHPKVQVKLLNYLIEKSKEKHLFVFIATHSTTMIRNSKASNILLLKDDGCGNIDIQSSCYPAMALGGIDYMDSVGFDYIFFVEDEMARVCLKYLLKRYQSVELSKATALSSIIPVGGYLQTAQLALNTQKQVFSMSKVFAFVDEDALTAGNAEFDLLRQSNKNILSLTFTPEVMIIDKLTYSSQRLSEEFKTCMKIEIKSIISDLEYTKQVANNPRKQAKKQFDFIVSEGCSHSGDCEALVVEKIVKMVIDEFADGQVKAILGAVFNMR